MDLFDLKVVGWSYELNMTDDLVIEAFNKALVNRGLEKMVYSILIVGVNIHQMILKNYYYR